MPGGNSGSDAGDGSVSDTSTGSGTGGTAGPSGTSGDAGPDADGDGNIGDTGDNTGDTGDTGNGSIDANAGDETPPEDAGACVDLPADPVEACRNARHEAGWDWTCDDGRMFDPELVCEGTGTSYDPRTGKCVEAC